MEVCRVIDHAPTVGENGGEEMHVERRFSFEREKNKTARLPGSAKKATMLATKSSVGKSRMVYRKPTRLIKNGKTTDDKTKLEMLTIWP